MDIICEVEVSALPISRNAEVLIEGAAKFIAGKYKMLPIQYLTGEAMKDNSKFSVFILRR